MDAVYFICSHYIHVSVIEIGAMGFCEIILKIRIHCPNPLNNHDKTKCMVIEYTYILYIIQCQKLGKVYTDPMCQLLLSFRVISNVYRSFVPNKTTFIKHCLPRLDFKAPSKFHGVVGKINATVCKTKPILLFSCIENCPNFNTLYVCICTHMYIVGPYLCILLDEHTIGWYQTTLFCRLHFQIHFL